MSDTPLGKSTRLSVGQTAGGKVAFDGDGSGLGQVSVDQQINAGARIGSRGIGGNRPGRFMRQALTFAMESNDTSEPVLSDAFGRRLFLTVTDPALSGDGEGPASNVTLTINPQDGTCRWSVTVAVDGLIA